ncbi:MAG: TolB family protein [Fidelibacterota bacterium]
MRRLTLLALITFIIQFPLPAQLIGDQHPPGLRWQRIRTDYFHIIVPQELLAEGQRVANTLEYLRPFLVKTMDTRLRRWSVVLNSRSAVSNGWVGYLPRMSEWYPVTPQDEFGGTLDWYHLLAVHEGRHMAQFDAFDRGFNRLAGICFGELGLGAFSFFGTPLWFLEGDAVVIETALSNAGRGRQPLFDLGIRTLLLSGKRYSYYKAYLQSYRDYFPDYYALGYQMVAHTRREFGADVWSRIMQRSAKYSYLPWSFSRSMKKITGYNARTTYEKTMDELEKVWQKQIAGIHETPVDIQNREKEVWTRYQFPRQISDGSIIALKSGLADPYTLVRLESTGRETRLRQIAYTENISVNADKIVWSEESVDPRWRAQSYSNVIMYDLQSGKRKQLTRRGKFFAPALSPDGQRIITVKHHLDRHCTLVMLDAENGHEIREFPNPGNDALKTPVWSEDGQTIGFIRQRNGKRALTVLDPETGRQRDIIAATTEDISYPIFYSDFILYDSPWSGIDNIYAVHQKTGRRYQITSRKFGSFYPSAVNDTLLFCDYQINGLNVVRTRLDTALWAPLENVEQRRVNFFEPLVEQEQGGNILQAEKIPDRSYPVESYSPLRHAVNVHSWFLLPLPPNLIYGIISNDYLHTMTLSALANYHAGEQVTAYSLIASYAGIRPVIDLEIGFGKRAQLYDFQGKDSSDVWDEAGTSLDLRFPIQINRGAWTVLVEYSLSGGLVQVSGKEGFNTDTLHYGNFQILSHGIDFSSKRQRARRDLAPRFGTDIRLYQAQALHEFKSCNNHYFASVRQFLPGLLRHHSLQSFLALEHRDNRSRYIFQSRMPRIRGYQPDADILGALDYSFPLLYPDLALGSFVFFKRLQANLFYDYGVVGGNLRRAGGAELSMDFTPLTLYYLELNAGVRCSYRIEDHRWVLEFILGSIGLM